MGEGVCVCVGGGGGEGAAFSKCYLSLLVVQGIALVNAAQEGMGECGGGGGGGGYDFS